MQVNVSGLCLGGLLQMEALFTCQRGLVSLPLGVSVAGSRRSEPAAPGTNGPTSPLPPQPGSALRPAPRARLPHTTSGWASAPGKGSRGRLKEGPVPFGAASPRAASRTPSPAPALTPHPQLGYGCEVQLRGTAEGLGFLSDLRGLTASSL